MADQKARDEQKTDDGRDSPTNSAAVSGDPGRTPGTAEGDRSTVEEDLRDKDRQGR